MTVSEAFEVLGLEPTDDAERIKRAFKAAIAECHPDRAPGLEDRAKAVTLARQVLMAAVRDGTALEAPAEAPPREDPWERARRPHADSPPPPPRAPRRAPPPPPPSWKPPPTWTPRPAGRTDEAKLERARERAIRWARATAVVAVLTLLAFRRPSVFGDVENDDVFRTLLRDVRNDGLELLGAVLTLVHIGCTVRWLAFRRRVRRRATSERTAAGSTGRWCSLAYLASFLPVSAAYLMFGNALATFEADPTCVAAVAPDACRSIQELRTAVELTYLAFVAYAVVLLGTSFGALFLARRS
jgi:hypothetical protein